ncbi:hypothetical protein CBS9595_003835 [Malassezia furfur]|nr:hypothetical protein CBS9595_003835 [Malassezia furfur]
MAPAPPAGEPLAVGEQLMQLDQAITLTLQEIDENFSQAHQVITSRILPAIHAYEAACQRTWSAAQFWKQFFETSAQVSLSHQPLEGAEETHEADASAAYAYDTDADTTTHERDVPVDDDSAHDTHDSNPLQSPPRLSHSIYAPLDDSASPRAAPSPARLHGAAPSDMSMSVAHDPSVTIGEVPTSSSPWKRNTRRRSWARPRVSIVGSAAAANPFASDDRPHAWDGIADLRTTPLRPGARSDVNDTSMRSPHGMSPPPMPTRLATPHSRWAQTPAKEAARLAVDDVLRSAAHEEEAASPPRSARRKSVVGTPLPKRTPSRSRRDSLPTPPTITKVHRASDDDAGGAHALDTLLALDDPASESSASDSDEAELLAPGPADASAARTAGDDTLPGAAPRTPTSRAPTSAARSLSDAVRRTSDEMRLLGL